MGASPGLMMLCANHNVSLCFLSPNGRYVGRFEGATHGNVLLRLAHFHFAEDETARLHLSTLMIAGKVQNYRSVLLRFGRDYGSTPEIEAASKRLEVLKHKILAAESQDAIRGFEGDAANEYFSVFPSLIRNTDEAFLFHGRNRRPPKDPVNALLSFVYTLLANECASALESVGLDPYIGILHTLRPGRTSLALDLMEEFRAYLGDRLVLSLINRKQLSASDFKMQGEEGVLMTDKARKTVLAAWQTRKREELMHPYLNERVPIGLLPYIQALLLSKFIRRDLDDYPVFLIR